MNSFGHGTTDFKRRNPKLGIIGGSGTYSFREFRVVSEVRPETKYGFPSDTISICEQGNELVAFLPRHGSRHTIAPHKIPYKANLAALKELGVEYVIGTCVVTSLKKEIVPGSIVLPDQFVNFTWGRDDYSEADGGSFIHLPMGEPYCEHLRKKIIETADKISLPVIPRGTVAVIQGPRFSTFAESQWLSTNGWDIVNMTQYPECYFARELGLCYSAIAAVTDYDAGLQKRLAVDSECTDGALEIFKDNIQKVKTLVSAFVYLSTSEFSCGCASVALKTYYEESL